jgi:hypothetical protein
MTSVLAVAAMMGGSQGASREYTLRVDTSNAIYAAPPRRVPTRLKKGRIAQNQRQRRKDRRRAWASGDKKAFR